MSRFPIGDVQFLRLPFLLVIECGNKRIHIQRSRHIVFDLKKFFSNLVNRVNVAVNTSLNAFGKLLLLDDIHFLDTVFIYIAERCGFSIIIATNVVVSIPTNKQVDKRCAAHSGHFGFS